MDTETFVFGETEVRKTGRTASKPGVGGKSLTLVEVCPINEYDGTWKKFVNPTSLYEIQQGTPK
jgi:hypothetical protein